MDRSVFIACPAPPPKVHSAIALMLASKTAALPTNLPRRQTRLHGHGHQLQHAELLQTPFSVGSAPTTVLCATERQGCYQKVSSICPVCTVDVFAYIRHKQSHHSRGRYRSPSSLLAGYHGAYPLCARRRPTHRR